MKTFVRGAVGLLVGLSLGFSVVSTASAEVPTGAARLIQKVQMQVTIAKLNLLQEAAVLQAAAAEKTPGR